MKGFLIFLAIACRSARKTGIAGVEREKSLDSA
jgi:hypothetical protein